MNSDDKQWYAVYTAPRAEKKVSERLTLAGIEHYLPLQKVKRKWSDRVKEIEVPVINGYIFVSVDPKAISTVTNIYGAIAFVREGGQPVAIPDRQITALRFMVSHSLELVEYSVESFEKGEPVTIIKGPLEGMIGELIEMKDNHKVIIRLQQFGCAITTVPIGFIQKNESNISK